jgi:hypothetical protein
MGFCQEIERKNSRLFNSAVLCDFSEMPMPQNATLPFMVDQATANQAIAAASFNVMENLQSSIGQFCGVSNSNTNNKFGSPPMPSNASSIQSMPMDDVHRHQQGTPIQQLQQGYSHSIASTPQSAEASCQNQMIVSPQEDHSSVSSISPNNTNYRTKFRQIIMDRQSIILILSIKRLRNSENSICKLSRSFSWTVPRLLTLIVSKMNRNKNKKAHSHQKESSRKSSSIKSHFDLRSWQTLTKSWTDL